MAKSNRITVASRVHDVMKLIVAGAEFPDIRQYATDKNWNLTERQIWRYVKAAHRQFAEAIGRDRDELLGRHLMQRRALYARALKVGDLRTALMVLQDEASLFGLYAPMKIAPTTPDGKEPFRLAVAQLNMDDLRALKRLKESADLTCKLEGETNGHANGFEARVH
jgi:hypothetical protein